MTHCGPELCRLLEAALPRKWLETDGRGGGASSAVLGLNTPCKRRRSHARDVATPLA